MKRAAMVFPASSSWLLCSVRYSSAEKITHATPATRLGACAAWLRLCRPFLGDEKKEHNAAASLDYLKSDLGKAAYPDDLTCVNVAPMPSTAPMDVDSDQDMYDDDG